MWSRVLGLSLAVAFLLLVTDKWIETCVCFSVQYFSAFKEKMYRNVVTIVLGTCYIELLNDFSI